MVTRAADGFSCHQAYRQFPWHDRCHASLAESALINHLHSYGVSMHPAELQMAQSLQHGTHRAFSKA